MSKWEGLFGLIREELRNGLREIAWNRRICREEPLIALGLLCKRMVTKGGIKKVTKKDG
ncbi:MAG: hypothetical protein V3U04_01560 [Candidatus Aerophobetes bacterium]